MYESKEAPLATRRRFLTRMCSHAMAASLLILVFFLLGFLGQVVLANDLSVHDAFLNTALLLGGIGAHIMPQGTPGKLFIAIYGFVTGLLFVATIGIIVAPLLHRFLHKFHLDAD